MGKKKRSPLQEVHQLDRIEREQYPYSVSYWWEAWEYCEYEEDEGDEDDSESGTWEEVLEGSLDDCFDALSNMINWDIENEARETGFINYLNQTYGDDDTQGYIKALEKFYADKKADFKRKCLMTGRCHRDKQWAISSAVSQEEIEYINQQKNSVKTSSNEE